MLTVESYQHYNTVLFPIAINKYDGTVRNVI